MNLKHLYQFFSLVLLISNYLPGLGQHCTLSGQVADADTGEDVAYCTIRIAGTLYGTQCDDQGRFQLEIDAIADTMVVEAMHINYITSVSKVLCTRHTTLKILMHAADGALPQVVISSAPDTVWGSKAMHVCDYAFAEDGILLLTCIKEERWKRQEMSAKTIYAGCQLVYINNLGNELCRLDVEGEHTSLYTGYFDEIFLQGINKINEVLCADSLIQLLLWKKDEFEKHIEPVIDSVGSTIYFTNYNAHYPAFEYMAYNRADSSYQTLRYLVNEELMQRFRAQYRDLGPRQKLEAFRMEVKTGIDKEIYSAYMTGFTHTPFFQPLNIPLFVANDTLLIFDHVHDKLYKYNQSQQVIDSLLINYHHVNNKMKWGRQLCKDRSTDKIYTWYEKAGYTYLNEIDLNSGLPVHVRKLAYRYAENLKLNNGRVYYIYRPFESSQKKFLYSEKL
ncbi:MAG: carboxypeptidase-like regulatory domain-containing protein [Flavobacteriales bacterium]